MGEVNCVDIKWKEYFVSIWYRKFWIAFVSVCVFAGLLLYSARSADLEASGFISLNYEGATEGLNPNGTRFSIHELNSEELIKKVIDQLGLQESISSEDLRDCLSMNPVNSQNPNMRYISSEYAVSLKLEDRLPYGITAEDVLYRLLILYHDSFISRFALDDSALDVDWALTKNLEFFEFGALLQSHVKNLNHYLDNLIAESGMAQYRIQGESFRSLMHSVNVFEEIYLNKYIAYVQEKHIFRDVGEYYNKLVYQRLLLDQRYQQAKAEYEIRRDVTSMYDKYMVAFVMVPMFDANEGLYMSRTKIGIDNFTVAANKYSISSGALAKSIAEIDSNMDRTRNVDYDNIDTQKAEGMIDTIIVQMNKLVQRIREATQRYEEYRSKTDMLYGTKTPTTMRLFNVKQNVIYTAGFVLAYCLILIILDQYRSAKKV